MRAFLDEVAVLARMGIGDLDFKAVSLSVKGDWAWNPYAVDAAVYFYEDPNLVLLALPYVAHF